MDLLGGESSESESEGLNLDNDYAAKYDNWRGKEHMQKLRDKYGDQVQDNEEDEEDESSSEEEDEDAEELTPDVEKAFFATMASLKSKDPALYDGKTTFFKAKDASEPNTKTSLMKGEKITLSDMERKIMLEKGGQYEDEVMKSDEHPLNDGSLSYNEELKGIKASFQNELNSDDENEDFLTKRKRTKQEAQEEDEDYKLWLAGQKSNVDETVKEKMGGLRDYWNEDRLDEGEKFLKDYLLNKRYLDKDDDGYVPSYDEIVHDSDDDLSEDERNVEKQEEFEHKFNFRFEEPDEEFIKRYPRTIKDSLRREDDKRKNKRKEVEERKKQEKETKKEEIRMLKNMKKKEIMDKIAKIRSLTGNEELEMDEDDIEGDFDPVKYDKKMQEMFKDYDDNTQEDEKPTFSDLDDDFDEDNYGEDFEDWDNWTGATSQTSGDGGNNEVEPHCEDEDFNMDCDFEKEDHQKELVESTKRKKGRRKSKFAQALEKSSDKPVFDPDDKTFSEYVDEYYKLDAEDHIGDMACRFRYRNVQQNDFGLSTEEILAAKDSELNAWASLRKTCQYRNEDDERKDFHVYRNKSKDANLKKKLLPSVFDNPDPEGQVEASAESGLELEGVGVEKVVIGNKKKKLGKKERQKKRKALGLTEAPTPQAKKMRLNDHTASQDQPSVNCNKKKKKKKGKGAVSQSVDQVQTNAAAYQSNKKNPGKNKSVPDKQESELSKISDDRLKAYGVNPNQVKRKLKSAKFKNAVKQAS